MKTFTGILFLLCLVGLKAQSLSPIPTPLTTQAKSNANVIIKNIVLKPYTNTLHMQWDLFNDTNDYQALLITTSCNLTNWTPYHIIPLPTGITNCVITNDIKRRFYRIAAVKN